MLGHICVDDVAIKISKGKQIKDVPLKRYFLSVKTLYITYLYGDLKRTLINKCRKIISKEEFKQHLNPI